MSIQKLFDRLDWGHAGLAAAAAAKQAGEDQKALALVIEHFKTREKPVYLFGREEIQSFDDREAIADADKVVRNHILGYDLGESINWRHNPTETSVRDPEWIWSLARMLYLQPLARAYALTNDEKYAKKYVQLITEFCAAWPVEEFMDVIGPTNENMDMRFPGNVWRTIEAGMRLYCAWIPTMQYFKESPSLDGAFWVAYLNGVYDHAQFLLRHTSNHNQCSNWTSMDATGLFHAGVMYPEFAPAGDWLSMGLRRISYESRYQIDHHGVHSERTPIYHLTAVNAFYMAYRLGRLNGVKMPRWILPLTIRAAEYLMMLVKPDFSTPMVGDADRNDLTARIADTSVYEGMNNTMDARDLNELRAFFRTLADETGRADFRWFATGGKQGSPPSQIDSLMADPGFAVMRTDWTPQASYMMVTGTSLERGESAAHSNYDAAHLELFAGGEDILIDSGRYLYSNIGCPEWRHYIRSTNAHNSVLVDDHLMGAVPYTDPAIRGVRTFFSRFEKDADVAVIEVMHNGYCHMEQPVYHERRVIWVRPGLWIVDDLLEGYGEHTYRLFFNFPPKQLTALEGLAYQYQGDRVSAKIEPLLTDGLSAQVLCGSNDPIGGWVSYGYSVKEPAPQLIYTQKGAAPARFVTAVSVGDTKVSHRMLPDGGIELLADGGNGEKRLILGADGQLTVG